MSDLQHAVRDAIWQATRGTLAADRVKVTEHAADAAIRATIAALAADAEAHMSSVAYWTAPEGDYVEAPLAEWLRARLPEAGE